MKANALEKLYLLQNGLVSYCRNTDNDVEYTRTDAFIEKAAKWINQHTSLSENLAIVSLALYNLYGINNW